MIRKDLPDYFGQVLKECRLKAGLSQEELALESGLDRTYISMLERGVKIPTLSTLVKLSKALSVTPVQFLVRAQQLEQGDGPTKKSTESNSLILFGTSVSCGTPIGESFVPEKELSLDQLMIKKPSETFFLKASGDSMYPAIWDEDILIITKDEVPKNGSIILAQINDEFTIKRYFKTSKGVRLVPDNASFKEITVSENDKFIICGVVKGTTRFL